MKTSSIVVAALLLVASCNQTPAPRVSVERDAASPRDAPVATVPDPATSRRVSGVILDERDAPVAGATVVLSNRLTRVRRTVTSDVRGAFTFDDVEPDHYELEASAAAGFADASLCSGRAGPYTVISTSMSPRAP